MMKLRKRIRPATGMERMSRNSFPATRTICRKRTCVAAPPTNAEIEAVAKRLLWNSCEWDGDNSDYAAENEEDTWDYAGSFPTWQEDYIRQAEELLALARRTANE